MQHLYSEAVVVLHPLYIYSYILHFCCRYTIGNIITTKMAVLVHDVVRGSTPPPNSNIRLQTRDPTPDTLILIRTSPNKILIRRQYRQGLTSLPSSALYYVLGRFLSFWTSLHYSQPMRREQLLLETAYQLNSVVSLGLKTSVWIFLLTALRLSNVLLQRVHIMERSHFISIPVSTCFPKTHHHRCPDLFLSIAVWSFKVSWFRMSCFSLLLNLLGNFTWSATAFTTGFLPSPASCSISLKSRKPSLSYRSDPGYCVAWKDGAGFDECAHSALLKADCPCKHQYLPWWQLLTFEAASERCCIQILCAPTGYCLNANQICEGGESSPFVHRSLTPVSNRHAINCDESQIQSATVARKYELLYASATFKPSGECVDDLYVIPSTIYDFGWNWQNMLEPHRVNTFLTANAANHQMILRATTRYLVPAVPASYSISLGRIAPQNPFKRMNLTTRAGKGAIAMWDRMSQISSLAHLWDYANQVMKSSGPEMYHVW